MYCFPREVAKPKVEGREGTAVEQEQKKTLKGRVTDKEGIPLPGVSVVIKGTNIGIATNVDGEYTLELPNNNVILVYSFVGMNSQEIKYYGQKIQNVTLHVDSEQMAEVVVTGMQRREKTNMIGSVATVGVEQLENVGSVTLDEAIKGQLAGVYVRNNSGRPGEGGNIQIRGINTLTDGNSKPLYILDGMPLEGGENTDGVNDVVTNGIGNIPPEDIESITILKDATAACCLWSPCCKRCYCNYNKIR